MKTELMEKLYGARDFPALTGALLSLCGPFGPVHAFRLVHNRGAGRVVCFIEMESPKQQPALVRALGAKVIEGAACLDVPVDEDFGLSDEPAPAMPASLAVARSSGSEASRAMR
jgi:RNA recognition motif-containing protein